MRSAGTRERVDTRQTPQTVVSGMGWETSLGSGVDEVWRRMLDGECGIEALGPDHAIPAPKAAPAPRVEDEPDPRLRFRRLALETTRRTIEDAGVEPGEDTWLVLGTCMGARLDDPGILESGMHAWARETGRALGFPDDRIVSLSTACSSGSDALLVGRELVRSGRADTCVCGGVDVVTEAKASAHADLGTLTTDGLRPFDADRKGTVFGEGAGVIVLERREEGSGRALPRIAGAGSANDAEGLTHPDRDGTAARLAIRRSLEAAGLGPTDVDLVNAHGSGTPINDDLERQHYSALFPEDRMPTVFAIKGSLGHTLGATGTLEAIATIKALQEGEVPPIVGLRSAIDLPFPIPSEGPREIDGSIGFSLTLGFGGFNTSVVLEVPR